MSPVPDEVKNGNTVIFTSTIALPLASSLLFVTSPTSMWGLINQYQLFLVLPFLRLYLPQDFVDFVNELQITLFDLKFMKFLRVFYISDLIKEMDYKHPYEEYRQNGVESGSFIVSQEEIVISVILIIVLNLIFVILL